MSQAMAAVRRMRGALWPSSSAAVARRLSSIAAKSETEKKTQREQREELRRRTLEKGRQQVTMAKRSTPLAEAAMAKLLVKRNYDPQRSREELPPIAPLAEEVMPSVELVETFSRDSKLASKLAHRVAEVELLYSLSDEVPARLGNDEWIELVDTPSAYERERYLRDLYTAERARLHREGKNAELAKTREARRQELTTRLNAGEMIYASGFHSLLVMVDRVYGARCQAAKRVRESRAKLLVDCRSLRYQCIDLIQSAARQIDDLYSEMILQRQPFDIQIVNLYMEKTIARAIKSQWHFLFGPHLTRRLADKELLGKLDEAGELGLANSANDESTGRQQRVDEALDQMQREGDRETIQLERRSDFTPHPFCPRLTTKGVRQVLKAYEKERELPQLRDDQIAYISPAAKRFLPDDLSRFRVFILMAAESEKNPLHGSVAAALADQLPLYRIPIEKHVAWYHGTRWRLTLSCQAQLIHSVHSGRMDWQEALSTHLPKRYLRPQPFAYGHRFTAASATSKDNGVGNELAPPTFIDPLTGHVAKSEGDEANEQHRQRLAAGAQEQEQRQDEANGEEEAAQLSLRPSDFGLEGPLGEEFDEAAAALPVQTELYDPETGEFFEYRGSFLHSNADPHLVRDETRRQRVKLMSELERDSVTRRLRLNRRPHVWERGGGEEAERFKGAKIQPQPHPAETIKHKRNHRYTREQRNAMRAQLQQLTE